VEFSLIADEQLDTSSVDGTDFDTNGTGTLGLISCSGSPTTCTIPVTASAYGAVMIAPSPTFSVADLSGNAQTTAGGTDRSVTYVAPPANDDVADAAAIGGTSGSIVGTTIGATVETGESSWWAGNGNSVWYAWTPKGARSFVATFSGGDCSTELHVSSPAPAGPPDWYPTNVLASSYPDGCVDHATMTFLANGGSTYWIRVSEDQTTGTPEAFTLTWSTQSAVRGSLSVVITNTRGTTGSCTVAVKGVNLAADQSFYVRSVNDATEQILQEAPFTTAGGRWSPDPAQVTAEYFSVGSAYHVFVSRNYLWASDGVTKITPTLVNRCSS
jgi:hypothetical protein